MAIIVDGATPTQQLSVDSHGSLHGVLYDAAGNVLTSAKGVQATSALMTQDVRDAGRSLLTFNLDRITGITTEALASMTIDAAGTTSTATSYTVTTGKALTLLGLYVAILASATTAVNGRVRVRHNPTGAVTASSPILLGVDLGAQVGTAAAGSGTGGYFPIPEGLDIPAGSQIGIAHVENSTSSTVSVHLVGYEF